MTIHFYLNNQEETHIHSMYDMSSNPFKMDDIIKLSVDEISPIKLHKYNVETAKNLVKENEQQRSMFHMKDIKLVREAKYIEIESNRLTIEYHCELIKQ